LLTIAIPVIALGSIVAAWKMRAVVG
jgi:hypothetical protein